MLLAGYEPRLILASGSTKETPSIDAIGWLALAFGLSLAFAPLLLLWTTALHIHLNATNLLISLLTLAAITLWYTRSRWVNWREAIQRETLHQIPWPLYGGFVLLMAVIIIVRFLQIRGLVVPAWVDSVHHTMIARLIAESGQVPTSYRPFMPVDGFYYHYGFHTLVAYFQWLSGLEMHRAMLVLGQLLNAGAALAAYLFTVQITRRRAAGMCAALVTGLISTMPAYYVSWGRYTQLTGANVLPVTIMLCLDWVEKRNSEAPRGQLFLSGIGLAGLFVTHYRVMFFALTFLGIYTLHWLWTQRQKLQKRGYFFRRWLGLAGIALLLAAPWLIQMTYTAILPLDTFFNRVARGSVDQNEAPLGYVLLGIDRVLVALAIGGAVWGLRRRAVGIGLLLLWIAALFISADPSVLHLPGTWLLSNSSTLIFMYVPISVLVGYVAVSVYDFGWERTIKRWQRAYIGAAILVLLGGTAIGIRAQLPILNPNTLLFEPADMEAMAWIRENIPSDAVFLINARPWMYSIYMGSDGGWWIPLLTDRQVTMPPLIYGYGGRDYAQEVNAFVEAVREADTLDTPVMRARLMAAGVTHIYIGARGGTLHPEMLLGEPDFFLLYSNDDVWIFKFR